MNTVGGLLLLFALGLIIVVGVPAAQSMLGEASASNDTAIQTAAHGSTGAIQPIFTVLGYVALIIGAIIAINAFR